MTEKTKKIIKITALGLCAAVLTVTVLAFLAFPRASRSSVQVEPPSDLGGMTVEETDGDVVSLAAVEISPEDFADYGIMPIAEKAYTLTATVNFSNGLADESGLSRGVTWEMDWVTESSRSISNYVQMDVSENTATFSCLSAFSTQIVVTARSKADPQKVAHCTFDYLRDVRSMSVKFFDKETAIQPDGPTLAAYVSVPAQGCHVSDSIIRSENFFWYNGIVFDFYTGTIDDPVSCQYIDITPSEEFKTLYDSYMDEYSTGLISSIDASPQSSSSMTKIDSLIHFYMTLTQQTDEQVFLGRGYDTALCRAFQECKSPEFTVDITLQFQHMGTKTYSYSVYIYLDGPLATVNGVTLNESSHVFY